MNEYTCWDCGKEIMMEGEEIKNGNLLKYKDGDEEHLVFKCTECYAKSPALTNYKKTEVYSRVVGYYRPVHQWNKGMREVYNDRKEFKCNDGSCSLDTANTI